MHLYSLYMLMFVPRFTTVLGILVAICANLEVLRAVQHAASSCCTPTVCDSGLIVLLLPSFLYFLRALDLEVVSEQLHERFF